MRSRWVLGISIAWTLCGASASALSVTLNPGIYTSELSVRAEDGTRSEVVRQPSVVPDLISDSVASGAASSAATFDLSARGFETRFDVTNLGTANTGFSDSITRIHFSVDTAVDYRIEGRYDAIDPDGEWAVLAVGLTDYTGGGVITLFSNAQRSTHTPDESFVVGGRGGDNANELLGSATGTLLPGRDYFFFVNALLGTQNPPTPTGTATGFARIVFVPEPGTGLLLATGLVLACGRRRS